MLGGSAKAYGINAQIDIKVDNVSKEFKEFSVSDFRVEMGTSNDAGICEIRMESVITSYDDGIPVKKSDISDIKVGHPLEILVASSSGSEFANENTIFKGFVESVEVRIADGKVACIIYGMDAKMWMMSNKFSGERAPADSTYEKAVNAVVGNYSSQAKKGKINIASKAQLKTACYQFEQSDYDFLCDIAKITGSLFFIDNEGKINFCSPDNLVSNSDTIDFDDGNVCEARLRTSVWGTVSEVTVTATDSKDSSKIIKSSSKSAKSIGNGKNASGLVPRNYSSAATGLRCITIHDYSINSKDEAQDLANAIYAEREFRLAEVELTLIGNPKLSVGKGIELKEFGDLFDGKYVISGIRHNYGIYSDDGKYHTILSLCSNRANL